MMKRLYVVYDDCAQTVISGVIVGIADARAIRSFHDALKTKDGLLAQHPTDFRLLFVGELDLEGGNIIPSLGGSLTCATGAQWVETQEKGMIINA